MMRHFLWLTAFALLLSLGFGSAFPIRLLMLAYAARALGALMGFAICKVRDDREARRQQAARDLVSAFIDIGGIRFFERASQTSGQPLHSPPSRPVPHVLRGVTFDDRGFLTVPQSSTEPNQ